MDCELYQLHRYHASECVLACAPGVHQLNRTGIDSIELVEQVVEQGARLRAGQRQSLLRAG